MDMPSGPAQRKPVTIKIKHIEKGNTQKNVNRQILEYLITQDTKKNLSILDCPSGRGEFLKILKEYFPNWKIRGVDLFAEPIPELKENIQKLPALEAFHDAQKYDLIFSISGVMVFDGIDEFIQKAHSALNAEGKLILTNDNIWTARDRLSFFFFGRMKRFKLLYASDEGNWNLMLIQGLWKILVSKGFKIEKIKYTSFYLEDYIFLPIVLLLYPINLFYLLISKSPMSLSERIQLFPFTAMLARHYILIAKK